MPASILGNYPNLYDPDTGEWVGVVNARGAEQRFTASDTSASDLSAIPGEVGQALVKQSDGSWSAEDVNPTNYPEWISRIDQFSNPAAAINVDASGFHYAQLTVTNAGASARTFTVLPIVASVLGAGLTAKGVNVTANQGAVSELWTGVNGTYLGLPAPANATRTYIVGPFAADALQIQQSASDANLSYELTLFNA